MSAVKAIFSIIWILVATATCPVMLFLGGWHGQHGNYPRACYDLLIALIAYMQIVNTSGELE